PVINATGVVLHTNLGRAPLAQPALAALARVGATYSNLEYDLARGTRGSRHGLCRDLLVELTGAEDAVVVNNAAGAVLVALSALPACTISAAGSSWTWRRGGSPASPRCRRRSRAAWTR